MSSSMSNTRPPLRAPGLLRLALEMRAPLEFVASLAAAPWLLSAPRGDGHGVIVYPGFMGTDISTQPMRRLLRWLGHDVHGWGQGRNLGPQPEVMDQALARIRALAAQHGRPVSLVGWSLGGLYARELAKLAPDAVRQVVSLGTPFDVPAQADGNANPGDATNAQRLFEFINRGKPQLRPSREALRQAPPVPTTSIYSRSDGVVAWQCSLQPAGPMSESIEVPASHIGLGVNPLALYALADRLAQPVGQWRAFERGGLRRWWFADPARGMPKQAPAAAPP
jgi:pimeloyl-ACP methyl ester carboxylesterase